MWKFNDPLKESEPSQGHAPIDDWREDRSGKSGPEFSRNNATSIAMIGPAIQIKGELTGSEDLIIDGKVDGKIELNNHHLTIGPEGRIVADIRAKRITIRGKVRGNVTAKEIVEIREGGTLRGDIVTPRIAFQEGAFFTGSVEMGERTPAVIQPSLEKKAHRSGKVVAEQTLGG